MPYIKAFDLLLPHDYARIKLFCHLAKEIYETFEFGEEFEIYHGSKPLTLTQLAKLNEQVKSSYVETSHNDVFVKMRFKTGKAHYLILEKLWFSITTSGIDHIETRLHRLKVR